MVHLRKRGIFKALGVLWFSGVIVTYLDSWFTGNSKQDVQADDEAAPDMRGTVSGASRSTIEKLVVQPCDKDAIITLLILTYTASTSHPSEDVNATFIPETTYAVLPASEAYVANAPDVRAPLHAVTFFNPGLRAENHDVKAQNPCNFITFETIVHHTNQETNFHAAALLHRESSTLAITFPGIKHIVSDIKTVMDTFRREPHRQIPFVEPFMDELVTYIDEEGITIKATVICGHSQGATNAIQARALLHCKEHLGDALGKLPPTMLIDGWAEKLSAILIVNASNNPALNEEILQRNTHSVRHYPATLVGGESYNNEPFGESVTAIVSTQRKWNPMHPLSRMYQKHRLVPTANRLFTNEMELLHRFQGSFRAPAFARIVCAVTSRASGFFSQEQKPGVREWLSGIDPSGLFTAEKRPNMERVEEPSM